MSVNVTIYDKGQSAPISTANSVLAWLGVSSAGATPGTTASVYQMQSPGVVNPQVGYGPGPEGVAAGVRVSKLTQVFVRVNGSIAGTNSSVSQSGSGPLPVLSGTPLDTYPALVQITRGGLPGLAQMQVAMDGATFGPVVDVPVQTAAALMGSVDVSGWNAGNYSAVNTLTLIVTPTNGVIETVTFSGTSTAINFLSQINAVIGPANALGNVDLTGFTWTTLGTNTLNFVMGDGTTVPVTFATPANSTAGLAAINAALSTHGVASLVTQGGLVYLRIKDSLNTTASLVTVNAGTANAALGLPATTTTYYGAQAKLVSTRYLKITDGTTGISSTLTNGAGTSNTLLGMTPGSVTGAAATYQPPNTGLTLTFPAGAAYVLNEKYTWQSTEPRFTTTDLNAAIVALQQSNVYFRDIVVLASPIDGLDAEQLSVQLGTTLSSMRGGAPRIFALGVMNSSIGTPSTIAANDLDVKAAFTGTSNDYVAVAHGDVYMAGTAIAGQFRRPLIFALGIRMAAYGISNDPADRELPQMDEASLVGPDLVTLARDEQTALTSMSSQHFTCAKNDVGVPYFTHGWTRSLTPSFSQFAIMRTAIETARVLYVAGKRYEFAKRKLAPGGQLKAPDAAALQKTIEGKIDSGVGADISNRTVTIDTVTIVGTTGQLNMKVDIQHLGYFLSVNIAEGIVDIISPSAATA